MKVMKTVMKAIAIMMITIMFMVASIIGMAHKNGFRYDSESGLNKAYMDGCTYVHEYHLEMPSRRAIVLDIWSK